MARRLPPATNTSLRYFNGTSRARTLSVTESSDHTSEAEGVLRIVLMGAPPHKVGGRRLRDDRSYMRQRLAERTEQRFEVITRRWTVTTRFNSWSDAGRVIS